jgi:hypothetical protein
LQCHSACPEHSRREERLAQREALSSDEVRCTDSGEIHRLPKPENLHLFQDVSDLQLNETTFATSY